MRLGVRPLDLEVAVFFKFRTFPFFGASDHFRVLGTLGCKINTGGAKVG